MRFQSSVAFAAICAIAPSSAFMGSLSKIDTPTKASRRLMNSQNFQEDHSGEEYYSQFDPNEEYYFINDVTQGDYYFEEVDYSSLPQEPQDPVLQGSSWTLAEESTPVKPTEAILSTLSASPVSTSIGALAFGGLAAARGALGQRQKKLDEEKKNLEEQQQKIEEASNKLQQDTSTNNVLLSTVGSVAVGTVLTAGGLVEEFAGSTMRSLEGVEETAQNMKGGGFKTTAGTIAERPIKNANEELPYLEQKIEQEAAKQKTTNVLRTRKQKLAVQQNELETMAAKREAAIAEEEARLKAVADEEERLRVEEEQLQRKLQAERNEAIRLKKEAEEAARVKAEEEARLQREAEEAARVKAEEEARLQREAEEAARVKAEEEARLQREAEEAARVKAEEEARLQREAEEAARVKAEEEARLQREAEEAARVKAEEEARLQREAEEAARVKAAEEERMATEREAERVRLVEEESKEKARQEAIAREKRALEILRQQEEEEAARLKVEQLRQSTGNSATAAGVSTLRNYATKLGQAFDPNQQIQQNLERVELADAVDTEQIRSLLNQLGISPGVAGGLATGGLVAGTVVFGSLATAVKMMLDEAEESTPHKNETRTDKDLLNSNTAILGNKSEEVSVRRTLKIPVDSVNGDGGNSKPSDSTDLPSNIGLSSQPPSSIQFGGNNSQKQPKVSTPPGSKGPTSFGAQAKTPKSSLPPKFGTTTAPTKGSFPPKKAPNPFDSQISQSFSSGPNGFNSATTRTSSETPSGNFSVSPPKKSSLPPKSGGIPTKTFSPPKSSSSFGYPTKGTQGMPPVSPFGVPPKKADPGKQGTNPFGTSAPKLSSFGGAPQQSDPKKQSASPFGKPTPKSPSNAFASAPKQGTSPFGTNVPESDFSAVGSSIPKNNLTKEPKSVFEITTSSRRPAKQSDSSKLPTSPFGTSTRGSNSFGSIPKQSTSPFGTSLPKSNSNPSVSGPPSNSASTAKGFGAAPSKSFEAPRKRQAKSNLGALENKSVPANESPFVNTVSKTAGPSNSFGAPPSKFSGPQPKQSGSAFGTPPKQVSVRQVKSPFATSTQNAKDPQSSVEPKPSDSSSQSKKPFSPFSQSNVSPGKSSSAFSSSGPSYMPPSSKASNQAELSNVYSTLGGSGAKSGSNASRVSSQTENSVPKKSFSPFGNKKQTSNSMFREPPLKIEGSMPKVSESNTNLPSSSFGSPSGSQQQQPQGTKKTFSPYGVPKKNPGVAPQVDPSSFSFGAPQKSNAQQSQTNSQDTSSFSFGSGFSRAQDSSANPNEQDKTSSNKLDPPQSYGTTSPPKPFAATGFPSNSNFRVGPDDKGSTTERDRLKDLEMARKRAMDIVGDDNQNV